jgi:NodT family efflux transporter outer membrane factor (OMF) lipoprotein
MLTNPLNKNRQHQKKKLTRFLLDSRRGFVVTPLFSQSLICLLTLVFLVSGCMVGPDFVKPDAPLEEAWTQQEDPRIKTEAADFREWWAVFNDPVLNNLIEKAYQQNLDLQVAGLRILEARAELGVAIGRQYPQTQEMQASTQMMQQSQNSTLSAALNNFSTVYNLGLDATWELDFWGRFRRGVESANASLYATYANFDDVLVSLIAEVARTYTQIRTFELQLVFARANVKMQEKSFEIATDRYEGGATSELDPTMAKALFKQTQSSIPRFEASLRQAKNALAILLGIPPIEIQNILGPPKPIPTAPPEVAVGIPADLLLRRPDIRRIEFAAAAQSARIGIAKSDLFPRISMAGSFIFQTSDNGGVVTNNASYSDLFSSNSITYFVGPQVQWLILNYGRIKNDVRAQDARFQQFLVEYRSTILRAMQDVEDGMVGFLRAQEEQGYLTESVTSYQHAVDLAQLQYVEGLSPYQNVVDAQRFLTQEQTRLASVKGAVLANLIATYKALGGGWELREGRELVPAETQEQMRQRTDWGNLLPPEERPDLQKKPPTGQEINILHMPDF